MSHGRAGTGDPFLLNYSATDLRIASEFLANWLPFLSRGLCHDCTQTLSDRIRSLETGFFSDDPDSANDGEKLLISGFKNESEENHENCDTNSLGSWKDGADMCETTEISSAGNFKDGVNVPNGMVWSPSTTESPSVRLSWADMAQEDEFEGEEENEGNEQLVNGDDKSGEVKTALEVQPKPELSREQREYIRFGKVGRKKDFICLERVKGKIVNILDGLELHTGIFSAAEQKRIVDLVYSLEEKGKNGELKDRTYTAPQKWMRGKGRVTIQFGCCYNYATDKNGNPPGILQKETVDPIPDLFKVIIRRLVRWHVLSPSCVPDSCIVNIYEEGDCIPPHIDNHDFVRPFCTVSFLSECNIVFGSNLKIVGAGEFSGAIAIPLPVGSVLVLNGNVADVAKHCIPAVPTKRISITFRKMDESKWPIDFAPEPDLQRLLPLSYEEERPIRSNPSKSRRPVNRRVGRREENSNRDEARGSAERANINSEPPYSILIQVGSRNRRRVKINLDS